MIETAFADEESALVGVSRHLCPKVLRGGLAQLTQATDVYITHIKLGEVAAVMSEIAAQGGPHRVRALASGDVMRVPRAT